MNITPRSMRDALSSFATGVTIVTTSELDSVGQVQPVGMTASSFNSVSMDPPLVLWSVTKAALSAPVFRSTEHFSIHVLSSDQVEMSNAFARSGGNKFESADYVMDQRNVPLLANVACRFDCSTWNVYEGGDHWIIVGQVEHIARANLEGLVFSGGSYATANPIRPPSDLVAQPGADVSPIDDMLIYNLARAYRQMSQDFHHAVRDSGLTIPEWRILASLRGCATRDLADLAERTFIDPHALVDMLVTMQQNGLCLMSAEPAVGDVDWRITGTEKGDSRVEKLFNLAKQQEKQALSPPSEGREEHDSERDLQGLVSMLQRVINNTL